MKPKSSTLSSRPSTKYPYLPLYLTDLQFLVALATESGFTCEITDEENEYESLDDLVAHSTPRVTQLSMRFYKDDIKYKCVRMKMTDSKVVLTSDSGDQFVLLENRLQEYLRKRVPWYAPAVSSSIWFIISLAGASLSLSPLNKLVVPWAWNVLLVIFLVNVLIWCMVQLLPGWYGGVHLRKKNDVVGPFARYEKVLLLLAGALITFVLSIINKRFFGG